MRLSQVGEAMSNTISVLYGLALTLCLVGCDEQTERVISLRADHLTRCPKHTWAIKSEFVRVAYQKDWQKLKDAPDLMTAANDGLIHPYVMVTCSNGAISFTNGADK